MPSCNITKTSPSLSTSISMLTCGSNMTNKCCHYNEREVRNRAKQARKSAPGLQTMATPALGHGHSDPGGQTVQFEEDEEE